MALVASSCATLPSRSGSSPGPAALEEIEELAREAGKRSAVSGNLLVTGELNGRRVTTPAVLLVEWPDKLRLELQDPLGGLLALVVLNGERFWLYDKRSPELLTGPVRTMPAGLFPRVPIPDLVRVFLARPSFAALPRAKLLSSREIVLEDGPVKEILGWKQGEIVLWRREEPGFPPSSAVYDDYEFKSGQRYPTKMRLSGPGPDGKERELLLSWKDWEPSVPKEKKLFRIPQEQAFGRKIKALP